MMRLPIWLLGCAITAAAAPKNLEIYWIDVEGGAATLVVTPAGESLLVDTGWRRPDRRDPKRIQAAAAEAGVKKLDYLMITHFHADHHGGLAEVAAMLPVGKFIDHGDRVETRPGADAEVYENYLKLSSGRRLSLKPGQKIPLKGVDVTVVASNGEVLGKPINGGGANAKLCESPALKNPDPSENARSIGILLSMGKFQFLDLGDLTWNKESEMACPENKVGKIDLYQVTHHGMDMSGAPQHIWAIQPQVAVMNNGPLKGGTPGFFEVLRRSPGIEDIWQVHLALKADKEHNTADNQIANTEPEDQCKGHYLKAEVESNGRYTITNSRNGFKKTYTAR